MGTRAAAPSGGDVSSEETSFDAFVGPTVSWVPDRLTAVDAWVGHVPFAFWIMEALRPRTLVELGTQSGTSYLAFCQAVRQLDRHTACFAVDTWKGDAHTGSYGEHVFNELVAYHDLRYAGFSRLVRATFAEAVEHFADGSIDLLHIDGLHTYEAVADDFRTWRPKLSGRAVVLLHDTNVREKDFGVWRFWHELAERHPHFEFLHSHGLGVLAVGDDFPPRVRQLFAASGDAERVRKLREHFWRLGAVLIERLRGQRLEDDLGKAVAFRDSEIARITGEVTFRDNEIARLTHAIAAKEEAIRRITDVVAMRDREIARLGNAIAYRDAEIARITGAVGSRDVELQRLAHELQARDAELARMAGEVVTREQAIVAITSSRSWRWSAGLRSLYPRVRHVRDAAHLARWYGGRTLRALRDEGLGGTARLVYEKLHSSPTAPAVVAVAPPAALPVPEPPPAAAAAPLPAHAPLVSIVMPVYDVPEQYLRLAIESVRAQRYPRWELCVADDASTKPHVRAVLVDYAARDPRIRVVYRTENGNISAATNSALEIGCGEFVTFLDHDDELTPDALLSCVRRLNEKPDTDVVYTDLALIGADGGSRIEFVKPDWSPEFFRGVMYVGHLLLVRRTLLAAVGGLDGRFDGVQDFELMLRLSERTQRIEHVREVLYHWRSIPGSIASGTDAKPEAGTRQVCAVNEHLQRLSIPAAAQPHRTIPHRVTLVPHERPVPRTSVVVWARGDEQTRRSTAALLQRTSAQDVEWIFVNATRPVDANGSDDGCLYVAGDGSQGRSALLHQGAAIASGELLLFLDAGAEVVAGDVLRDFAFHLAAEDVGIVGPLVVDRADRVEAAGLGVVESDRFVRELLRGQPPDGDGYFGALPCTREVSALPAVCLGVRRSVYTRLGGFDPFLPDALFDVDLCLRARAAGYRNLYVATCRVLDDAGVLAERAPDPLDLAAFADVWDRTLAAGDPYYDPRGGMA